MLAFGALMLGFMCAWCAALIGAIMLGIPAVLILSLPAEREEQIPRAIARDRWRHALDGTWN